MGWLKRIFFIFIIILSASLVYYGLYNDDRVIDAMKREAKIENPEITRIATQIQKTCLKQKTETCYALETKKYLEEKTRYREMGLLEKTFILGFDVNTTLNDGSNCIGIAVLGARLLKELDVDGIYFMTQRHHCFIGVDVGDTIIMLNNIDGDEIIGARKVEL